MINEEQAPKPGKTRRAVANPAPNMDLFGDLPENQATEKPGGHHVERLGPAIRRLQLKLRTATDKVLADEQLTTAQLGALNALERAPGATSAELARAAGVTAQTMHEIIRLLTTRGWVERTQDPEHGRKLQQQLSATGRKALLGARRRVERVEEKLASPLKPHERILLLSLLERCAEGL
jgi:DNA-binding MarR family transcriptional regulator